MEIEIIISTDSLGDENTPAENQRYIELVQKTIEAEFPNARVSAKLTDDIAPHQCYVSDDLGEKAEARVREIANQIWEDDKY